MVHFLPIVLHNYTYVLYNLQISIVLKRSVAYVKKMIKIIQCFKKNVFSIGWSIAENAGNKKCFFLKFSLWQVESCKRGKVKKMFTHNYW